MEIQALAGKAVAIQKMAITGAEAAVCPHGHGACADENEALRCQHLQPFWQSRHIAHPFPQSCQHQIRSLNNSMRSAGLGRAQRIGHIYCFPVFVEGQLPRHGLRDGDGMGRKVNMLPLERQQLTDTYAGEQQRGDEDVYKRQRLLRHRRAGGPGRT